MKIIVCGAGQVGLQIAKHLSDERMDGIVIDKSSDLIKQVVDELDVSATALSVDNSSGTGADTTLFGVFYALGDSTELNISYIEVENDDFGQYGTGISALGSGTLNNQVEIIQFGILTMF